MTMELTTPLYPNATRILMLGSGELGREVVIEAMRLGIEVIACDRYENAPGMQFAHRAHVIDMLDPNAIRRVVQQERPTYIVPEIEAIATDTLLELEAEATRRGGRVERAVAKALARARATAPSEACRALVEQGRGSSARRR